MNTITTESLSVQFITQVYCSVQYSKAVIQFYFILFMTSILMTLKWHFSLQLFREVRIMKGLNHPNIGKAHTFISMDWIFVCQPVRMCVCLCVREIDLFPYVTRRKPNALNKLENIHWPKSSSRCLRPYTEVTMWDFLKLKCHMDQNPHSIYSGFLRIKTDKQPAVLLFITWAGFAYIYLILIWFCLGLQCSCSRWLRRIRPFT